MSVDIFNISSPAWMLRAKCAGSVPDLHYPDNEAYEGRRSNESINEQAEQAIALCNSCPVREECLAYAEDGGIKSGIWGGKWLDRPEPKKVNQNVNKTHCPYGHEYNEANTRYAKSGRKCRECDMDAWRNRKSVTHCLRGHEFTEENTHTTAKGRRQCRACNRIRNGGNEVKTPPPTECPKGHPYDEENTAMDRGSRRCRTCTREDSAARREAKRGSVAA